MSFSWTDRQGQVEDLAKQSKEQLQELLLRQEKILSNRRLIQTLPDKGKKLKEFADKLRLAIEDHDEEERRQSLVCAAATELQSKYQQAFIRQQRAVLNTPASASDAVQEKRTSPVSTHVQESAASDEQHDQLVSRATTGETMEMAAAALNSGHTKESDLVEALERVRLSETSSGYSSASKDFLRQAPPSKPHYLSVLEKTEKTSAPKKEKFKPNQPAHRGDASPSGSLSPTQSSEGSLPLPAQARRDWDRKHLDDITAARLPLLHHSPAQLLSLEESFMLLHEHTKKQQELQAKLAAQKLSESLKISMGNCTPDGGPMAAYREVHDEGAQLSSDEG